MGEATASALNHLNDPGEEDLEVSTGIIPCEGPAAIWSRIPLPGQRGRRQQRRGPADRAQNARLSAPTAIGEVESSPVLQTAAAAR